MARLSPEQEEQRIYSLYEQQRLAGAAACVLGVDEVGRGPVAGPLTVAAVVLPPQPYIPGLDDSKRLSAKRREELSAVIHEVALATGMAHIEPAAIDRGGMALALRTAMVRAIEACGVKPDLIVIDGRPMHLGMGERCIVKGDSKVACIAAASIIAKVARDALMVEADLEYPGYGFASNKGYASAEHIKAIQTLGLSPLHRVSFCQGILQQPLF